MPLSGFPTTLQGFLEGINTSLHNETDVYLRDFAKEVKNKPVYTVDELLKFTKGSQSRVVELLDVERFSPKVTDFVFFFFAIPPGSDWC